MDLQFALKHLRAYFRDPLAARSMPARKCCGPEPFCIELWTNRESKGRSLSGKRHQKTLVVIVGKASWKISLTLHTKAIIRIVAIQKQKKIRKKSLVIFVLTKFIAACVNDTVISSAWWIAKPLPFV